MSSDEDYMSAAFIEKCAGQKDLTPGLIKNRSYKRQHEMLKRRSDEIAQHRKRQRSVKQAEVERREQGLQESLGSDNKGFAMLQKMGYKPGQGIGKTESGLVNPISITVKSDRFGLGRASVLQEIAERKAKKREQRLKQTTEVCSVEDYRRRIAEKNLDKQTRRDLYDSQKACARLDIDKGISAPDELWFWPENPKLPDDDIIEEEEEIQFEPSEKLPILTRYLRECYLYCVWCGTQFTSREDLADNCPGPLSDCH